MKFRCDRCGRDSVSLSFCGSDSFLILCWACKQALRRGKPKQLIKSLGIPREYLQSSPEKPVPDIVDAMACAMRALATEPKIARSAVAFYAFIEPHSAHIQDQRVVFRWLLDQHVYQGHAAFTPSCGCAPTSIVSALQQHASSFAVIACERLGGWGSGSRRHVLGYRCLLCHQLQNLSGYLTEFVRHEIDRALDLDPDRIEAEVAALA